MASDARAALLRSIVPVVAANPSISLVALARAVGVGRTTLYRHFGDLEALHAALVEYAATSLLEAHRRARPADGSAVDALRRLCGELFERGDVLSLIFADRPIVTDDALEAATRKLITADDTHDSLASILRRGQAEGTVDPTLPDAWMETFVWLSLASAQMYGTQADTNRHESFALAWTAITRTLLTPAPSPSVLHRPDED